MVLVRLKRAVTEVIGAAVLAIVADETGQRRAARLIGPVADAADALDTWSLVGLFRVDPHGRSLASMVGEAGESAAEDHDWGALGLPDGLDTRVSQVDTPRATDDAVIARASTGHRIEEATWWLTVAPGDSVAVDGSAATLVAVDRRKRTADIERDGEAVTIGLDDLEPGEVPT